jgi:predicted metal-dependent TIM-barrel fold hydrolase
MVIDITNEAAHMIDTHAHVDTRPYEDFELMAVGGLTDVLTLAHDPMRMSSSIVFRDHFERLFSEKSRVEKNGLRLHVCLGLHPRARPDDLPVCISLLESYLADKARPVTAIGEAGLETKDPIEVEMLQRQIELAMKYDLPIILHTPRSNKGPMTREIISVLSTFSIEKDRVVIDHADADTARLIVDRGYNAGLTVQPGKLSPKQAVEIVKKLDPARLVLNTDMSSAPTDVLSIPRTVLAMRQAGIPNVIIEAVSGKNAWRIFRLKI